MGRNAVCLQVSLACTTRSCLCTASSCTRQHTAMQHKGAVWAYFFLCPTATASGHVSTWSARPRCSASQLLPLSVEFWSCPCSCPAQPPDLPQFCCCPSAAKALEVPGCCSYPCAGVVKASHLPGPWSCSWSPDCAKALGLKASQDMTCLKCSVTNQSTLNSTASHLKGMRHSLPVAVCFCTHCIVIDDPATHLSAVRFLQQSHLEALAQPSLSVPNKKIELPLSVSR